MGVVFISGFQCQLQRCRLMRFDTSSSLSPGLPSSGLVVCSWLSSESSSERESSSSSAFPDPLPFCEFGSWKTSLPSMNSTLISCRSSAIVRELKLSLLTTQDTPSSPKKAKSVLPLKNGGPRSLRGYVLPIWLSEVRVVTSTHLNIAFCIRHLTCPWHKYTSKKLYKSS